MPSLSFLSPRRFALTAGARFLLGKNAPRIQPRILRCLAALVCFVLGSLDTRAQPLAQDSSLFSQGTRFWETRGNGFILEMRGDHYRMFEATRLSLLPIGTGEIREGSLIYNGAPLISTREFFGQSSRIPRLPQAALTGPTDDPIQLFDLFWTTIDENYAFFNLLPPGEWRRLYRRYRPTIQPGTSSDQLWTTFGQMIERLNDGHTFLYDFNRSAVRPSRPPSPSRWMIENLDTYLATIVSYLDSFSAEENIFGRGNLIAGTIGGQIGYINLFAFDGYGDRDLTPARPGDPPFSVLTLLGGFLDEPAPFSAILDQVLGSFADLRALIIDLRFNGGGSGDLAVELANRLTDHRRLAYSYRVRHGSHEQFENTVTVSLTPKAPGFLGRPVIVLTSNNTVSAGDLAAMILRELPRVTLRGETTYGIFSEAIPRQLPVKSAGAVPGWTLTLSTQRLFSARGEFLEQRGVPPKKAVAPSQVSLAEGTDNMLEEAIEYLAKHYGISTP